MAHLPSSPPCQHSMLAHSPIGHVAVCADCGVVHLSLNCVSVRLEPGAFLALVKMLNHAQQRMGSDETPEHSIKAALELHPVH